ncbi:MAPEG family protein [Polyangium sp. y55x31]|uniref:MAPEG family protein n=1 Tax=Polyangium sp. y55x31 TaxID=3042688 RepID=UPI0024826B43|nr:MAPEG family protein [Polyangium sp. y55x31]MDI1482111.1 MAPEG family protein [Polyangium sp. y55x31]
MSKDLALPALTTIVALVTYFALTINVGLARTKFNVPAPQTSGNPDFERRLRVQQNTVEQIIPFLPALWICALFTSPKVAAGLGAVWILGRIIYAWGYYQAAEKRGPGFGITMLGNMGLLIGSIYGVITTLL